MKLGRQTGQSWTELDRKIFFFSLKQPFQKGVSTIQGVRPLAEKILPPSVFFFFFNFNKLKKHTQRQHLLTVLPCATLGRVSLRGWRFSLHAGFITRFEISNLLS